MTWGVIRADGGSWRGPGTRRSTCARLVLAVAVLAVLGGSVLNLILGIPAPAPSWRAMLDEGRNYITTGWWLALFPGLAILVLVLGINLVRDRLRDVLDPRLERGL
jgi:peptide/nickel transport system permease protein